jgi:glycerol-3-phosphate dehydrogenase
MSDAAADRAFDLLVVGGGIFGVAAAREAALNGWSVVLCERGDLAEETSSRSSKLLHGGLRYLERFELGLVREALAERTTTARLAPHLARPLPFLAPVFEGARVGPLKLRAGLFLYDRLAGTPKEFRRAWLRAAAATEAEPHLRARGLRGAGRYFDFQTFDSRLTAEIAIAAARKGAVVLTRAEVAELKGGPPDLFTATVRSRDAGGGADVRTFRVRAKAVIAATGPFSDLFRSKVSSAATPRARLTSGTHVVLPRALRSHGLILEARSDGRVFFVLPFEGRTLVGTTDRDFRGDPSNPRVEDDDVDYLLDEVGAALDGVAFKRSDVLSSFTGVRALFRDGEGLPSSTSREQTIFEEPRGVVHVLGGKLTTWRPIGRALVEAARKTVQKPLDDGRASENSPLPGGDGPTPTPEALARAFAIDLPTAARIAARYGARAEDVLAPIRDDERLREPIGPTLPELRAELRHLRTAEFATTVEDALRRRLPRLLVDRVAPEDLAAAARALRG